MKVQSRDTAYQFPAKMADLLRAGRWAIIDIRLEPQPAPGVEVVMIGDRRDIHGVAYTYHAMTVGQGHDTQFFRCPLGIEGDTLTDSSGLRATIQSADVVEDRGVWYWQVEAKGGGGGR